MNFAKLCFQSFHVNDQRREENGKSKKNKNGRLEVTGECVGVIVSEEWVLTHTDCCNAWEAEIGPWDFNDMRYSHYVVAGHLEGQGIVPYPPLSQIYM